MRYDDDELQDLLAAEWVLGSLRGGARRRMHTLMQTRPRLRQRVLAWEERWFALELRAPAVRAPGRVWRAVRARIAPRREAWWRGWPGLAGAALAGALAMLLFVAVVPPASTPPLHVALLDDAQGQAALLLSWRADAGGARELRVRVLAHPQMPAGTTWQAWLLADDGAPALRLGTIGVEPEQLLPVPASAAAALASARRIGISVERKGATGGPSLPFLFSGPAWRIEG